MEANRSLYLRQKGIIINKQDFKDTPLGKSLIESGTLLAKSKTLLIEQKNMMPIKNITITEATNKMTSTGKNQIKLKDERGLIYTVWQNKQDGSETMAYSYFKTLPNNGVGQLVNIGFKEDSLTTPDGKLYTSRTINMMDKGIPAGTTTIQQIANRVVNDEKLKEESDKWDRLAFGKCKFGFLIEAYKAGKTVAVAEIEAEQWTNAAMRKLAENTFSITNDSTTAFTPEDDIDIKTIPF